MQAASRTGHRFARRRSATAGILTDLAQDPLFLQSAWVSFIYVVFSCVPVWVLSLALAVLFNREIRAKNFFRSAAFMPVVMPAVVNAVVWTFMYHQDGVVNTILGWFSLDPIPWLRSSKWALWAVILIGIWRATPYYMVIFLAGLTNIPGDMYEAARIDGANGWQTGTVVNGTLTSDPMFGPLVAFGMGGVNVEVFRDVAFRVAPLTDREVDDLLHSIRGFKLLEAHRGRPAADLDALRDLLSRVAYLGEQVPELRELTQKAAALATFSSVSL